MTDVTRRRVEAVMDECDRLTLNGFLDKHNFGMPKEFWVVSPTRKANQLYPAKAVAAVALGWPNINGGYSTNDSACRVLERAGYIIVDRNGRIYDPEKELTAAANAVGDVEREQIVIARVGQALFRKKLLARAQGRCEVTGIAQEQLLRASHIKSWAHCERGEHLDVHNGILLSSLWDAAFDSGLVTFLEDGTARPSPHLSKSGLELLSIGTARALRIGKEREHYLQWHREHRYAR